MPNTPDNTGRGRPYVSRQDVNEYIDGLLNTINELKAYNFTECLADAEEEIARLRSAASIAAKAIELVTKMGLAESHGLVAAHKILLKALSAGGDQGVHINADKDLPPETEKALMGMVKRVRESEGMDMDYKEADRGRGHSLLHGRRRRQRSGDQGKREDE